MQNMKHQMGRCR